MKTAIVTGPNGQDGSYLIDLLLGKGYTVHALERARSTPWVPGGEQQGHPRLVRHVGDLLEHEQVAALVRDVRPDEVYNLAAQSFVPASWQSPIYTAQVNAIGPLVMLEAIRRHSPASRFYQATSSEAFGRVASRRQDEATYHHPRSPYGATKSFGMNITRNYRESFSLFACNGILFNHESERRGPQFVTRKISRGAAMIRAGKQDVLLLGNLDARRDWGHAQDYVRAMWMMLQHKVPDDYVVATGESHSIRDFATAAFAAAGMPLTWSGRGSKEVGKDKAGTVRVRVDAAFLRPAEVDNLEGDASKARRVLGWRPEVTFQALVERMVRHDLAEVGVAGARPAPKRQTKSRARTS